VCGSAWSVPTHRPLNGDSVLHGESPHYRVSPGSAWSDMVHVDYPSRRPHGSQRACRGSSGMMATCRARSVARSEAVGDWTVSGKVSMGVIHGPRCTCLTRLRVLAHSEEDVRQRGGAHRRGRRHRSSTAVKVLVLWVEVKLQALVKLLDLRTGREEGWTTWQKTEVSAVVTAYRRRTRALARMICNERASFYSRALRGSNVSCARGEEGM
jgi:hypothetical protein